MTRQKYDDSANTRWWCVFGLVTSWFVAIIALLAGAACLYVEIRDQKAAQIKMSHKWREVLPLGLNILGKHILSSLTSPRPHASDTVWLSHFTQ